MASFSFIFLIVAGGRERWEVEDVSEGERRRGGGVKKDGRARVSQSVSERKSDL